MGVCTIDFNLFEKGCTTTVQMGVAGVKYNYKYKCMDRMEGGVPKVFVWKV